MGSDFLSFDEAADRLGRSTRSVHLYVKQGLIRKERRAGEILLRKEDVEQLALEQDTDQPALTRRNFLSLIARVQRLERDMTVVRKTLNIQTEPFRPEKEEAVNLHRAAETAIAAGRWDTQQAVFWAGVFERLDEVALEVIGEAVGTDQPWKVFFQLCHSLMKRVSYQPDFKVNLELQQAHLALDEARKKLRAIIVTWTEMGKGTIPSSLLRQLDGGLADLEKALAAPRKKK